MYSQYVYVAELNYILEKNFAKPQHSRIFRRILENT